MYVAVINCALIYISSCVDVGPEIQYTVYPFYLVSGLRSDSLEKFTALSVSALIFMGRCNREDRKGGEEAKGVGEGKRTRTGRRGRVGT
jgi:hypothetical protein